MSVPATFVIIDCLSDDAIIRIVIEEDERRAFRGQMLDIDPLVSRLKHIPWMEGATRWAELDRAQIQMLIAVSLMILADSKENEREGIAGVGLRRAILALILQMEEDTGWVSLLKINHIAELHIEVDVAMTISAQFKQAPSNPGIRIIADNTEK